MHEVHLVRAIVEDVEKRAAAKNACRVRWLKIRFNPLTSHSAQHVRFGFDIVKQESSLLHDAELLLTEVEPLLSCQKCGTQFHGHHLPDECPKCQSVDVVGVNPTDMVLEEFEIDAR